MTHPLLPQAVPGLPHADTASVRSENQRQKREALAAVVSLVAAIITLVIGGIVLVGWIAGIPVLRSFSPSWVAMKANTAICLLLHRTDHSGGSDMPGDGEYWRQSVSR